MTVLKWILVLVVSYLLGCIQTGVIISGAQHVDIRAHGSKSTGTTNVFRVLGAKASLVTFVGDVLKGVLACLLGLWLLGNTGASLAGIAVVLGHMYPVFYKFKGGKGVATSLGTSLVLNPLLGLILLAVSAVGIAITHVVSIFSIVSLVAFGLINPFLCKGDVAEIIYSIVLALLVVWAHRTNIKRLLSGTENKLDFSRKKTKRNLK